jgi:hypothetical protein
MIMSLDLLRTRGSRRGLAVAAVAALATTVSWTGIRAAGPGGIRFDLLASVGDPIPGDPGVNYVNDFEPGGLNNNGDLAFGADVSTGGEGVFFRRKGEVVELGRTGGSAPGGGTYEFGFLGTVALNDQGDVAFNFLLTPFTQPFGVNSGCYRFSRTTGTVTPVVIPFVTPVPGGGTFQGTGFYPTMNNRGDIAFPGIIQTDLGVHIPGQDYPGVGIGIFRADKKGSLTSEVIPGDPAPGGGQFDFAYEPWINQGGDIAFSGHVAGEEAAVPGFPPQTEVISALTSLYLKDAAKGTIRSIVHAGDPAPGGGVFRQTFHPVMNDGGDIVFAGDVTPAPDAQRDVGAFLFGRGNVIAIARPGDPMPGGGNLISTSLVGGNYHINNGGDVVFSARLDSDTDGDGTLDTGLFQWSNGQLSVIARSGTVIPDVGTIFQLASAQLVVPPPPFVSANSGAINNDRGQVVFQATLTDGTVVMVQATPTGKG